MFSGKTTELLRRLEAAPRGQSLAFKHVADSRYSDSQIISHAGKAAPAIAVRNSSGIIEHLSALRRGHAGGLKLIVIDEGHFFDDGLLDAVRIARHLSEVVVAALQPDSWGRPFDVVSRLIEFADEPVLKQATCARCTARADRTQRLTPIINGQMVVDPDNYEPRCQPCWRPPPERPC
jgi:thymidine kinase